MEQSILLAFLKVLIESYPEIVVALQQGNETEKFLSNKESSIKAIVKQLTEVERPQYIIEEVALKQLVESLGPSRFDFIVAILEDYLPEMNERLLATGLYTYEVLGILYYVEPILIELDFNEENQDDRFIRYALVGAINTFITENKTTEADNGI